MNFYSWCPLSVISEIFSGCNLYYIYGGQVVSTLLISSVCSSLFCDRRSKSSSKLIVERSGLVKNQRAEKYSCIRRS